MTGAGKKLWGWYFFDWATQPYSTLMVTFVFGPFLPPLPQRPWVRSERRGGGRASARTVVTVPDCGWAHRWVRRANYRCGGRRHRAEAAVDYRVFRALRYRLNVTVVDPTGRVQYVMDALCVWGRFYRRGVCIDFYQRPTAQPWPNKVDLKNFWDRLCLWLCRWFAIFGDHAGAVSRTTIGENAFGRRSSIWTGCNPARGHAFCRPTDRSLVLGLYSTLFPVGA